MDKNSLRQIIEDHIINLEGNSFQDFCDRLCMTLHPGDYTPVRPGGPQGDMKNDGYCPRARIFFAAHATRGEQLAATKTKIAGDLEGCLKHHSDIQQWIYLTNDTLPGPVETYVDEELRPTHKDIEIQTWGHKRIASTIYELPVAQIEFILGLNLGPAESREGGPLVDVMGVSPRGGSDGHFERFAIKNIGDEPAIDCRLSVVGDGYQWVTTDPRLPKTLAVGETLQEIEMKISEERIYNQEVGNLKVVLEYEDRKGFTIVMSRGLTQERVPSGLFFNLKRGRRNPPTVLEPAQGDPKPFVTLPMQAIDSSAIIKEDDYLAETARLEAEKTEKLRSFTVHHSNSSAPQAAAAALNKQYQPLFDTLNRRKSASDRLYEIEVKETRNRFSKLVEESNNDFQRRGLYHSGPRGAAESEIHAQRDLELEKLKIKYGKA